MAAFTHPAGSAGSAGLPSPAFTHPAGSAEPSPDVQQATVPAPTFAVVRRGYDPDQVMKHLSRIDAETALLAADRTAAVEQATRFRTELDTCRGELDAARAELVRLRAEVRAMTGPPETVETMNERLQAMLRLAKDEFGGMRATAAARAAEYAAEIIASVGADAGDMSGLEFDPAELRCPQDEQEIERMRQEAAAERVRLDEEAAARRGQAEEEFRRTLALRCREAMAQVAKMQNEAVRTARRVLVEADQQAQSVLADARDAVRRSVDDAQREVDELSELRQRLAAQLHTSRALLAHALPDGQAMRRSDTGANVSATAARGEPEPERTNGATPAHTPATPYLMSAPTTAGDAAPAAEPDAPTSTPAPPAEDSAEPADGPSTSPSTSTLPAEARTPGTEDAASSSPSGTVRTPADSDAWRSRTSPFDSGYEYRRAEPVRILPRVAQTGVPYYEDVLAGSDVPEPSRIPAEEQQAVSVTRRYP